MIGEHSGIKAIENGLVMALQEIKWSTPIILLYLSNSKSLVWFFLKKARSLKCRYSSHTVILGVWHVNNCLSCNSYAENLYYEIYT